MSKELEGKSLFDNGMDILLMGSPDMLSSIITTVAGETSFQGWGYILEEEATSTTHTFRKLFVVAVNIQDTTRADVGRDALGIITLHLLPGNQTLFRVPPRRYWNYIGEKPSSHGSKESKYYFGSQDFNLQADESFFGHLLACFFAEFQRLGVVHFEEKKPPIGFRLPHKEKDG